jgi:hypothetical protein
MDGGIALYSSSDLYAWHFESVVLPVFNCTSNDTRANRSPSDLTDGDTAGAYPPPNCANGNGLDLERPKVVQCGGPGGKFVMWVRGTGYGAFCTFRVCYRGVVLCMLIAKQVTSVLRTSDSVPPLMKNLCRTPNGAGR